MDIKSTKAFRSNTRAMNAAQTHTHMLVSTHTHTHTHTHTSAHKHTDTHVCISTHKYTIHVAAFQCYTQCYNRLNHITYMHRFLHTHMHTRGHAHTIKCTCNSTGYQRSNDWALPVTQLAEHLEEEAVPGHGVQNPGHGEHGPQEAGDNTTTTH